MRFYCTSTGPIGGLNCEVLLYIICTYVRACKYVLYIYIIHFYIITMATDSNYNVVDTMQVI